MVIDPQSTTVSIPKETWKEYLIQKKRHLHAGKFYRGEDKRKIGLYSLSHALFWLGGVGLLIYFGIEQAWEHFLIVFGIIVLRSILVWSIFKSASQKLSGKVGSMNSWANDLFYLVYFWILGTVSYQAKDIKWK